MTRRDRVLRSKGAKNVAIDRKIRRRSENQSRDFSGRVFWLTGLSGAGKTTIGEKLWSRLRQAGRPAIFLDGDRLRTTIADDLGHMAGDRRRSAMRNGRLCQLLSEQGIDVVCATISLFHDVQRWNREQIRGYCEIYLRVPMEEIERRNSKRIYARARGREITNVVGIDIAVEEPEAPDLVIENYGTLDADAAVDLIWERCVGCTGAVQPSARLGTKAETLEWVAPRLRHARVLPQIRFTVAQWRTAPRRVCAGIAASAMGKRSADRAQ